MIVIGWIIWGLTGVLAFVELHIILEGKSEGGVRFNAGVWVACLAVGMYLTATLDISMFHLLWYNPASFIIGMKFGGMIYHCLPQRMVPWLITLIIAAIGAFVHGVIGFFIWGLCGHLLGLLIGLVGYLIHGGIIPRGVRTQTVQEFIDKHPEAIKRAYPEYELGGVKYAIGSLLNTMMERAYDTTPMSMYAESNAAFFKSAAEIAEEQPTQELKELAYALIAFTETHPRWYGHQHAT